MIDLDGKSRGRGKGVALDAIQVEPERSELEGLPGQIQVELVPLVAAVGVPVIIGTVVMRETLLTRRRLPGDGIDRGLGTRIGDRFLGDPSKFDSGDQDARAARSKVRSSSVRSVMRGEPRN